MKTTGFTIAIIILFIVSVSCVSTQNLLIEIPQPSSKNLPADIQSLTLVNRTVDEKYSNLNIDSLQNYFYKNQFNLDMVVLDSQAVDTTLKALGELLFESGRYDYVIPQNRFLPFEKNAFLSTPMPWDEVKELCETYNTDAVLSLDYYKTNVKTKYDRESYFSPVQNGFFAAYVAEMEITYEALFRVYDPDREQVLVREFLRDTLIWEDANNTTRELFRNFTPVKKALYETGIAIALDFSEKIGTNWRQENRKYFTNRNSRFSQANQIAESGDWETAITIWKDLADQSGSKSIKSKAQYNVAVGYEMLGDINQAVSWALKSYETMYRPVTYDYLEILKKRVNELNKLKK